MKKTLAKILCLALACVMAVGCFVSCGDDEEAYESVLQDLLQALQQYTVKQLETQHKWQLMKSTQTAVLTE